MLEVKIFRSDILQIFGISSSSSSDSNSSSSSSSSLDSVDCGRLFTQKQVLKKNLGNAHKGWKLVGQNGSGFQDAIDLLNRYAKKETTHGDSDDGIHCVFTRRTLNW